MNDRFSGEIRTAPPPPEGILGDGPSLTTLVSGIVHDIQQLVRQEMQLARTEVKQEWDKAKTAAGSLMVGLVLFGMGGVLLSFMVVYLIALAGVPLWGCFGIVGGLLAFGGLILVGMGYSQVSRIHVIPPQTAQTLKENVTWIQSQT
jgi:uncharacterized membrane protein YqjE